MVDKMADTELLDCDCKAINEELVSEVQKTFPIESKIQDTAELFRVFGDGMRMKILWALVQKEMCVCDLAFLLNTTKSSVSHQLRVLKQARLVKFRKAGKMVYYSHCDDHIKNIIEMGFEHIEELYV